MISRAVCSYLRLPTAHYEVNKGLQFYVSGVIMCARGLYGNKTSKGD